MESGIDETKLEDDLNQHIDRAVESLQLPPHLWSAHCYIQMNADEDAHEELELAESLIQDNEVKQQQEEHVDQLKAMLV